MKILLLKKNHFLLYENSYLEINKKNAPNFIYFKQGTYKGCDLFDSTPILKHEVRL